jgi:hypothetical protein
MPVVYTSGVEVTTTSKGTVYRYPPILATPPYVSRAQNVRIQTREDELGLLSFQLSESNLTEEDVDAILIRVADLKQKCKFGGEMRRYELRGEERLSTRPRSRGYQEQADFRLQLQYQCHRPKAERADKPEPISGNKRN